MFLRTFEKLLEVDYKRWGIDQSLAQLILNDLSLQTFKKEYKTLKGNQYKALKGHHQELNELFSLLKGEVNLTNRKFLIMKLSWIPKEFRNLLLNPNGTIVATPPELFWNELWQEISRDYPQLKVKDFKIIEKVLSRTYFKKDYLQAGLNYPQFSHFMNALKLEFDHPEVYRLFAILQELKNTAPTENMPQSKLFN